MRSAQVEPSEFRDNQLAKAHAYIQTFSVDPKEETLKTRQAIHNYIQNILNDKLGTIGIVFYDSQMFIHTPEEEGDYTIHFQLLALRNWNDQIRVALISSYFKNLQEKIPSIKIASERILEKTRRFKRDPASFDVYAKELTPGCSQIPGDNCLEKCLNFWLIVPRVQWDFFDLLYQMYTFDIFHQGLAAKFVHFYTIPTNVVLSMMFCAQFNLYGVGELRYGNAFAVNGALILLGVLGLAYILMGLIRHSLLWGFATFLVLCLLNIAGNMWYYSYRNINNPWYNPTNWYTNPIIWSYGISMLQASSHLLVPQIPSYISGVKHWESLHMFFCYKRKDTETCCRHMCFVILSLATFPFLSVSVAWFSWPHLIGTEVIYIMAGIGYRPSFFEKYFRVVEKMSRHGNPVMDRFPTSHKDVLKEAPACVNAMKECHLISEKADDAEVFKSVATLQLCSLYLRKGIEIKNRKQGVRKPPPKDVALEEPDVGYDSDSDEEDPIHQLDVMLAARKGYMKHS